MKFEVVSLMRWCPLGGILKGFINWLGMIEEFADRKNSLFCGRVVYSLMSWQTYTRCYFRLGQRIEIFSGRLD